MQEKRTPPPLIFSYMSRAQNGNGTNFRFFLNLTTAITTNVFLNIYLKPSLEKEILNGNLSYEQILNQLESIKQDTLNKHGRSYGGGLFKLEPKELLSIPLPNSFRKYISKQEKQLDLF